MHSRKYVGNASKLIYLLIFCVLLAIVAIVWVNKLENEHHEHVEHLKHENGGQLPEVPDYPYLNRRVKPFPWGNNSLFYNPEVFSILPLRNTLWHAEMNAFPD
jgi:hypothetical protein